MGVAWLCRIGGRARLGGAVGWLVANDATLWPTADESSSGATLSSGGDGHKAAGKRGSKSSGAASVAGPGQQQHHHHQLACLSAQGLDLFAGAAPLRITIEL
jgi:hypothetical protein